MRHPEHGLLDARLGGLVEHGVEERDGGLGALEPEALLADVAGVQEALEGLGGVQAGEDVVLLLGRTGPGHAFDVLLDPALLLWVLDVHVLDRRSSGSRRRARCEELAQGELGLARPKPVDDELRSRSQIVRP